MKHFFECAGNAVINADSASFMTQWNRWRARHG
jgi:hypothetical protein